MWMTGWLKQNSQRAFLRHNQTVHPQNFNNLTCFWNLRSRRAEVNMTFAFLSCRLGFEVLTKGLSCLLLLVRQKYKIKMKDMEDWMELSSAAADSSHPKHEPVTTCGDFRTITATVICVFSITLSSSLTKCSRAVFLLIPGSIMVQEKDRSLSSSKNSSRTNQTILGESCLMLLLML